MKDGDDDCNGGERLRRFMLGLVDGELISSEGS